ncbi:hypothetical protein C1646_677219 [Rhizophagus diaphanus]|nr:hypothetical protein C1646_677219 [Rhizophagus diaphanus] [Rhizophagus sp. MUCL 43196]
MDSWQISARTSLPNHVNFLPINYHRLSESLVKRAYERLLHHSKDPVPLESISRKSERIESYLRHTLEVYENLLNKKRKSMAQEKLLCPRSWPECNVFPASPAIYVTDIGVQTNSTCRLRYTSQMHLLTDCLNELKTHCKLDVEFWESTDNPSLKKFLDFRFQKGVLGDKKTEYSQYKSELSTIKSLSCISSVTSYPVNYGWQWEKTMCSVQHVSAPSLTTLSLTAGSGKRLRSVSERAVTSHSYGEQNKIRAVTFDDEESAIPIESSFIPTIPVELSTPVIDTQDDDVFNKKVSREAYIKVRQDARDRPSQKDWFIGEYDVSNAFRNFQITNIDRLESGDTFFFSLNIEEILSLHHIMLVDLTRMKKPSYVITDERNWRASVRQPSQPDPADFFGSIMNEYEKVINDIDELRVKFYEMWGKYCDKVIYSDGERRLFETTQIVARVLYYERMHMFPNSGKDENEDTVMHEYVHDTFKETFRDSNYHTVWANSQSLTSKDYRSTYGRSQGKKTDLTIYRIMEKGEREEFCFVEAKRFSVTRISKVGGYNLYKVAIFCQGGVNNRLLLENKSGTQSFGGHICEGYIYFCMMDLEYDGVYRFFQLSEIKLAQKLSEFNLVRKLILFLSFSPRLPFIPTQCRIDNYYASRNNHNESYHPSSFIRNPTVTPTAPSSVIPDVCLKNKQKKRKSI